MKKVYFFMLVCILVLGSCKQKIDKDTNQESRRLFVESATLINDFYSYFQQAKDSAELDSLMDLFDKKLTDINFTVPPETDMKLTSQDNDSLFRLMERLRTLKDDKLASFKEIKSDSIVE